MYIINICVTSREHNLARTIFSRRSRHPETRRTGAAACAARRRRRRRGAGGRTGGGGACCAFSCSSFFTCYLRCWFLCRRAHGRGRTVGELSACLLSLSPAGDTAISLKENGDILAISRRILTHSPSPHAPQRRTGVDGSDRARGRTARGLTLLSTSHLLWRLTYTISWRRASTTALPPGAYGR